MPDVRCVRSAPSGVEAVLFVAKIKGTGTKNVIPALSRDP